MIPPLRFVQNGRKKMLFVVVLSGQRASFMKAENVSNSLPDIAF
jgi:hypothetical protein